MDIYESGAIPGMILVQTYPLCLDNDEYIAHSVALGCDISIKPPQSFLRNYLERAIKRSLFTPCVLGDDYDASLLAPSDIEGTDLLAPGQVVTLLEMYNRLGLKEYPHGYTLFSKKHLGDSSVKFFAQPTERLIGLSGHHNIISFQGVIEKVPRDGEKLPVVTIKFDSKNHSNVLKQNEEALPLLNELNRNSDETLWWHSALSEWPIKPHEYIREDDLELSGAYV